MTRKSGLAATFILALGAMLWLGQLGAGSPGSGLMAASAQESSAPAEAPATAQTVEIPDMILGEADAPVTIVEYASYTCPHCAHFHDTVFQDLKRDYIDTGKVKFVFREVYFDRYGLWAAMLARCGGDTRYFGISSMLFEQQKEWAGSNDPTVVVENLKTIGRTAGIPNEDIQACLEDKAKAEAMLAKFEQNAAEDKITATPTLIINGEPFGNMGYDDLKAVLDKKLAG